jgi:hypothetical protein
MPIYLELLNDLVHVGLYILLKDLSMIVLVYVIVTMDILTLLRDMRYLEGKPQS